MLDCTYTRTDKKKKNRYNQRTDSLRCEVLIIWEHHNLKRLFSCHQEKGETALHLAVLLADRTSLHILDFLAQNWSVCYGNLCYTSVCVCVCAYLCVYLHVFLFFFCQLQCWYTDISGKHGVALQLSAQQDRLCEAVTESQSQHTHQ